MKQLLVFSLVVLAACSSSPMGDGENGGGTDGAAIDWSNNSVALTAQSLVLTYDDHRFVDASAPSEIEQSSNGSDVDVTWSEDGFMPRVHFDFRMEGSTWSVGQVRVYHLESADWIRTVGPFYMTPFDQAYNGDLTFELSEPGHHVTISLAGAHLDPYGF